MFWFINLRTQGGVKLGGGKRQSFLAFVLLSVSVFVEKTKRVKRQLESRQRFSFFLLLRFALLFFIFCEPLWNIWYGEGETGRERK